MYMMGVCKCKLCGKCWHNKSGPERWGKKTAHVRVEESEWMSLCMAAWSGFLLILENSLLWTSRALCVWYLAWSVLLKLFTSSPLLECRLLRVDICYINENAFSIAKVKSFLPTYSHSLPWKIPHLNRGDYIFKHSERLIQCLSLKVSGNWRW